VHVHVQQVQPLMDQLQRAPSAHSITVEKLEQYTLMLGSIWAGWWRYKGARRLRKLRFEADRRAQSALDKVVEQFIRLASPNPADRRKVVVSFGAAHKDPSWRHRRGFVRGPTAKVKKLLSTRVPVVETDEFCSTKLCPQCGHVLQHPRHRNSKKTGLNRGVSYCPNREHHFMVNRDTQAAYKIGFLFMARVMQLELGPFNKETYYAKKIGEKKFSNESWWPAAREGEKRMVDLFEYRRLPVNGGAVRSRFICKLWDQPPQH